VGQASEEFFFEKKNQKTFADRARAVGHIPRQRKKVFWFFFQKRSASLI
jgi:hypothetical protein